MNRKNRRNGGRRRNTRREAAKTQSQEIEQQQVKLYASWCMDPERPVPFCGTPSWIGANKRSALERLRLAHRRESRSRHFSSPAIQSGPFSDHRRNSQK